jgi:hypothetical protein
MSLMLIAPADTFVPIGSHVEKLADSLVRYEQRAGRTGFGDGDEG